MKAEESSMRKYLLAVCALAFALFVSAPAPAQAPPAINPQVAAILAGFPTGGPGLRAAIAAAVEANPSLSCAVIAAAAGATDAQKQAIGAGLADVAAFFAKLGTNDGRLTEAVIQSCLQAADSVTRFWFQLASASTLPQILSGSGPAGMTTNSCRRISPSGPGAATRC
jgi:hypothetical protein